MKFAFCHLSVTSNLKVAHIFLEIYCIAGLYGSCLVVHQYFCEHVLGVTPYEIIGQITKEPYSIKTYAMPLAM